MGATREMKAVADLGLAHAYLPGLLREEPALRFAAAWATQAGEMPVLEAIRVCESLAGQGDTLHPPVLLEVATLRAMIGEFEEARELIARARRLCQERERVRRPLMFVAHSSGAVEILAGDLASAERELRAALQMALDMGERDGLSQVAASLSLILTGKGEFDEAGRLAALSAHHASAEGVARALSHAAKAGVSRGRGQIPQAERLAKEAARLSPTGMPNLRADLLVSLAEVLRAGGNENDAGTVIGEAIELYERKGNLVSTARARAIATAS
jgi:tetratricopeptide (TPR) repeat protein